MTSAHDALGSCSPRIIRASCNVIVEVALAAFTASLATPVLCASMEGQAGKCRRQQSQRVRL